MLVSLLVTVVASFNNRVEKIGEDFVGLFVASDGTDGHDEGMAGVVDTGLFGIFRSTRDKSSKNLIK